MRITTNTYPNTLISQLQYLQEKQLKYQTQIATGLKVQQASDSPADFQQAQAISENLTSLKAYLKSSQEAQALGNTNYQAMSDLQKLISRASELAIRSSGAQSADAQRIIGDEMGTILDQVVQLANRQYNGNYLFGGTGNVAPIVKTADGPPPTYEYNNAPISAPPNTPDGTVSGDYTANVTKVEIADGYVVDTGFVAGRSETDDPAGAPVERPAFNGFLYNGTIDLLATLTNMRDTLNAGNAVTAAQMSEINQGVNLVAEYVGKAAGRLSSINLNIASLQSQINSDAVRISDHVSADLAVAATELQRTQLSYQAALQSGAKILNMSLLDYL